ncbi:MAG: hypothetical protein ACUVTD_09400 [Nitrososphaerales archaeon]
MVKEESVFLNFLRIFFRRGAEDALDYLKSKGMIDSAQADSLKNTVLKHYQIWYLIDEAGERFNPNIDANWALALVSSTLIENVIKGTLSKLGHKPSRSFEQNAKRLVEVVKPYGIELDLQELIEAWSARNIPVHETYLYPISAASAQRSYERALRLINVLSSIRKEEIFCIDWSEPSALLTRSRVIVVGGEAYYMGEPYDSWVRQKNIRIEKRPPDEDYHKYLESKGIRCTHQQPPSIEWLGKRYNEKGGNCLIKKRKRR